MKYRLDFTDIALADLALLKRREPLAYKKTLRLIDDIMSHPETGFGHPEPLKGNSSGLWFRRITSKHQLVYKIENEVLTVLILAADSHYNDK